MIPSNKSFEVAFDAAKRSQSKRLGRALKGVPVLSMKCSTPYFYPVDAKFGTKRRRNSCKI